MQTTRTPQAIQLELMRLSSFNEFDGDLVADSLEAHRDLWRGAMIDRAAYFTLRAYESGECDPVDDIKLRDLPEWWNVDTIYVTPTPGNEAALEALARTWNADEIDWRNGPNAGRYLRVWFD